MVRAASSAVLVALAAGIALAACGYDWTVVPAGTGKDAGGGGPICGNTTCLADEYCQTTESASSVRADCFVWPCTVQSCSCGGFPAGCVCKGSGNALVVTCTK